MTQADSKGFVPGSILVPLLLYPPSSPFRLDKKCEIPGDEIVRQVCVTRVRV